MQNRTYHRKQCDIKVYSQPRVIETRCNQKNAIIKFIKLNYLNKQIPKTMCRTLRQHLLTLHICTAI